MVDSTGESTYAYDLQDRLTTYTPGTPSNREIRYDYNNLGQKTIMTLKQSGNVKLDVDYLYYANGWLKEVDKGNSWLAKYTYDQVGNRTKVNLANTTYTAYTYDQDDPRYFLDVIGHYDSSNALLTSAPISYSTRDDSGNPTEIQDWDGTRSYTYDASNRLTSGGGDSFGYDWVGNRLNPPTNPSPAVYDPTDKLVRWPLQHQYGYLPTGSLQYQYDDASPRNLEKTFAYTGAELLSSVTHVGASYPSEMEWDADSNRVSFTSSENTGTWEFVYDTTAGIPAVIEENDGDPVYYIREPGGALIARIGASTRYYHFDALGSTRILTDYQGNKTDAYAYDAWGQLIDHTTYAGSVNQPYLYVGELGYYSHYQDEHLFDEDGQQLLELGVRFYDPGIRRFTQVDPVPTIMSEYSYCRNQPTIRMDPDGRKSKEEGEIKDIIDNMKATGQIMDTAKWCRAVFGKAFDNIVFEDRSGAFRNPGWKFLSKHCPDLTKGDIECTNEDKWKPQCVNCLHKLKGLMTIEETIKEWFDIYGDLIKIIVKKGK